MKLPARPEAECRGPASGGTRVGVPPLLIFGWGNRSRGDDALGPLLIERLRALPLDAARVELLEDYQLMVEHALDLRQRERVLFVDASRVCPPPLQLSTLQPGTERNVDSHAMSPQALLQVCRQVLGSEPPPASLLAIRGERFDLGAPPSATAQRHLEAALACAVAWLTAAEARACTS